MDKLKQVLFELAQTKQDLQKCRDENLSLRQSLEDEVEIRTRELEISEKLWSDAFDAVDSPVFLHNKKGRILRANRTYLELAGSGNGEVFGKFYWDVFPKQAGAIPGCLDATHSCGEENHHIEQDISVGERIYRSQSFAIYDEKKNFLYSIHYMVDATEKRQAQQALQRYEQIVSTSKDLIAFYDKDHNYLAVNETYAEYFGVKVEDIINRNVVDVIGIEHYECHIQKHLDRCLTGVSHSFQVWVDFDSKGKRLLSVSLTPYIDATKQAVGLVSRCSDITEKHEKDKQLQLSAKVFENTLEGIIVTDKEGIILTVNRAFSDITGYSKAEVLGENPRLLKSDRHDEAFYREMWQQLEDTGQWRGEIWNRNKTGEIYPELLTISSIEDNSGKITSFVAVFSDISAIKQVAEQLEHQAHHHPLTGLPNRLLLNARLEHSIQHAVREGVRGAVMFLDLDNFKKINDSLGHSAGDKVLIEVAERLQENSRDVDTVAHLSGDEFVIVLLTINTTQDAKLRAEQLLASLQKPFNIDGYELYVSGSIGIAEYPDGGSGIEVTLKNADAAMYKAKESGKNCCQLYQPEFTEKAIERVLFESNLRRAVKKNELVVYYQPQVELPAGNIVALEALIRWQHPELGLIFPDNFITLSEDTGLILPIGEWVLRTACEQLLEWRKQGFNLQRIAVNLSGKQIQQEDLPNIVKKVLDETGCPASSLELEITEGFIMRHPEQSIAVLQRIRDLGVELSVDDFGTGHSSLNYLRRLPINRLKIDRTFVWDIGENADGEAITKAVIAMGQSLNLQITAEGIETDEQKKFLEKYSCNDGQGYLFSRPLSAADVSKVLERECKKKEGD